MAKQKKIYLLDDDGNRIPLIDKKTGQQKLDNRKPRQWKKLSLRGRLLDNKSSVERQKEQIQEKPNRRQDRKSL